MQELSLRERKYAATKAALMDAVISRLASQTLDEVAVKDVCNEVQVSETTFFNYFPTKQAVIVYFVQIWSIAVAWEMEKCLKDGGTHLDAIRSMFDWTAQQMDSARGVMGEIVVFQARNREDVAYAPLTTAEYMHHFPESPEIQKLDASAIDPLLIEQLKAAQQAGEIPADSDVEALILTLMSIFFVTPIITGEDTQTAYRRQLNLLLPG